MDNFGTNTRSMSRFRFSILPAVLLFLVQAGHAQIGRRIKDKVKNETNYQINKKVDEATDKAIKEADTLLTGKKRKQDPAPPEKPAPPTAGNNTNTNSNNGAATSLLSDTAYRPPESSHQFASRMNTVYTTITVFTSCRCEAGKKLVEKNLPKLGGLVSAMVNITNGEIKITYNGEELNYSTITRQLNEMGFEADGSPAAAGKKGCN